MIFSLSDYLKYTSKKLVSSENGKIKLSAAQRAFALSFGFSNTQKLFQTFDQLDYASLSTKGMSFRGYLISDHLLNTLSKELCMIEEKIAEVIHRTSDSVYCAEYNFLSGSCSIDTAFGIGLDEVGLLENHGFCFPGFTSIYLRHSSGKKVGTQFFRDCHDAGNQDNYLYTTNLSVRDTISENGKGISPNQDKFLDELLTYINNRCPDISTYFRSIDLTESGEEYLNSRKDCMETKIPRLKERGYLWNPSFRKSLSAK